MTQPAQAPAAEHPSLSPVASAVTQVQEEGGDFKLLRTYLIDSLAPGRRICFELEGGAVLTGVNGRGKTSLLQLLLLFNGSNPTQLVSKGKSSFIEYYLPNTTSYIVFEYQVFDGSKRMVIAYSNTSGDKVFYRFVRQGYDPKIFVTDDGQQFVSSRYLRQRLTELQISYSPHQIETYTDYRAVIQYNLPQTVDRKHRERIKDLCADYAFTRYNKPLTNMDRLAFGMFSQTSNFDVLKSIVIESIFDNQTSHRVGTQRSAIETWPSKYKAYTEVMQAQEMYEQAQARLLLCDADLASLATLREQTSLMVDHVTLAQVSSEADLESKRSALQLLVGKYDEAHLELKSSLVERTMRIEQLDRDIKAMELAKEEYDTLDIPGKELLYRDRGNVQGQINSLRARKEAMTASHTPIVSKYEMIKAEIMTRFSHEQAEYMKSVQAARGTAQESLAQVAQRFTDQLEKLEQIFQDERAGLSKEVQALFQQLGACKQSLQHPQVPADIVAALERADELVNTTRASHEAERDAYQVKEGEATKARHEVERASERVSRSAELIERQKGQVQQIIKDNTPAEGSLLHALREARPQWGQDIARVLRTDILHRADLSPAFFEGTGVFGMELDLANLDACHESDPDYLTQLIEDEQRKLEKMQEEQVELASFKQQREREEKRLREELAELWRTKTQAQSNLVQAQSAKTKARFEFDKAQREAKDIAMAAAEQAQERLELAQAALSEFESKHGKAVSAHKMARVLEESDINDALSKAITGLDNYIKAKEIQSRIDIKTCQDECNDALKEQGVDAESLKALDEAIAQCHAKLEMIDELKPLLSKWVVWHREIYSSLSDKVQLRQQEKSDREKIVAAMTSLEQAHLASKAEHEQSIAELSARLKSLSDQHNRGTLMLERLKDHVQPPQFDKADSSWSIESLAQMVNQTTESLDANNKALDKMVSGLKRRFEKTVNSTVFETYEHYRQNHSMDQARDYMAFFETWYTQLHTGAFETLRQVAVLFTQDVMSFHERLKTFSDKLNRFNRDLQSHLGGCNDYFREIQDLNVHIASSVDELRSWGTIKAIVEGRGEWINAHDRLPDSTFVHNLEILLDQWDVKNGITAEFKHLITIRGQVTENGNIRKFKRSEDLKDVSSHGLSYLILILLFVAFWRKIKKDSPVNLLWALDELKVISENNIESLMRLLKDNNITLVSAFPDPDVNTLRLFKHAYTVDQDRRLVSTRIEHIEHTGENRHV